MSACFTLRVGAGCVRPEIEEGTLFLTVPDIRGTYTLPYIQSGPDLEVEAQMHDVRVAEVRLSLCRPGLEVRCESASVERPRLRFAGLPSGDYVLDAVAFDGSGREVSRARLRNIGVGTVIAALGDSITEGYRGVGFHRGEHLAPMLFPAEAVSRDRRNFPQFSPTTHHQPGGNAEDGQAVASIHRAFVIRGRGTRKRVEMG